MKEVSDRILEYTKAGVQLVNDCKPLFTDMSYSLEDRWNLMVDLGGAGLMGTRDMASEVFHSINKKRSGNQQINLDLYDDFDVERYETRFFADLYDDMCYRMARLNLTQEDLDEWREYVLKMYASRGIFGFEFDW